ncbi:uncharacterized protein EHS24_004623 [Apiotrichum porosum]|uniref:C2H2-type domain-containing protein n=1 Tax=Apiotrichum porosum TaxID=105984 RepID=A0A427Y5K5_9TREE|nr:uncharacterized protein EHS24_004623 [Apiotrichum porosum]RSH86373.1 hypothetical protein EHS24_004623 [Apiotrichum porosum]
MGYDYPCRCGCGNWYLYESARNQHEIDNEYYCAPCCRKFMNYNNIQQHLNSRLHRGQNVLCPFCKRGFTTATGLTHHLERNSCPKADIGRDKLYNFIRNKDPEGVFSKKLIGYGGTEQWTATDKAWNGSAWECYLCNRTFRTSRSLNQHLNSPIHQHALYHCPKCHQDFTTLAAVINHFESESCGFTRFQRVQDSMADLISSTRRLTF